MKNIYIIIFLLILTAQLRGQNLGSSGICSGSNYATSGGYSLSYTAGDMTAVQTVRSNNTLLTQGLLQPFDHNFGPIVNGNVTPVSSTICKNGSQMFTLVGYHGQNIQWQYNKDQNGSSISWSNFGTNADTATLNNISSKIYVRALVSSYSQSPVASTDGIVLVDSISVITLNKLTSTEAGISWQPMLGASKYTVHYNDSVKITSSTACILSGLSECTAYSIYVTSDVSACGNNTSDTIKFKTSPAPLTLTLSAGATGFVNASWTGNTHNKYKLYVGNTISLPNFTVYIIKGTSYSIPVNTTLSRTMIAYVVLDSGTTCSLKPFSNYAYYNIGGNSCTNNAPVITSASFIGKTLTVSWTGSASGYQFLYKRISYGGWASYYTTANRVSLNVSMGCYLVLVVNRCSKSPIVSGFSSNIDTVCSAPPCPAPTNLVLSNITCRGFSATWNAVNGTKDYGIYFSEIKNGITRPILNYRSKTNSFSIRSLARNKTYEVYVVALNCAGGNISSEPSNTETLTTLYSSCKDDIESDTLSYLFSNSSTGQGLLKLYPNPSNGNFTLSYLAQMSKGTIRIEIINLLGQVVYSDTEELTNSYLNKEVSLKGQSAGTYFVRLSHGNTNYISRLIMLLN